MILVATCGVCILQPVYSMHVRTVNNPYIHIQMTSLLATIVCKNHIAPQKEDERITHKCDTSHRCICLLLHIHK